MASGFFIVPDIISDKIYEKLEAAYAALPEAEADKARAEKDEHYKILLSMYNDMGYVPDFTVIKKKS